MRNCLGVKRCFYKVVPRPALPRDTGNSSNKANQKRCSEDDSSILFRSKNFAKVIWNFP